MAGLGTHDSKCVKTHLVLRYSERRFGTSYPRPLICRNSTIACALRFGWRSRKRSDEHIIGLENRAVLARSVRRNVEGKRWNERALKKVTGTPWNPRTGEVVARRRYITRALVESYGPTGDCGACFRKSQQHTERCRARFDLLYTGEDGPVEAGAQEVQPAPPDPEAPNLILTLTAAQTGGVDTDVMESEDTEPAVSSRAHVTAAKGTGGARKQTTAYGGQSPCVFSF